VSQTTDRRTTRLDPAVRRGQILEAAGRLFEARDPLEVPFEEIAYAAGVSRALVYNYFGDRSGLLAAVYLHHFQAVRRHVWAAAELATGPEDQARATVRAYLEFAATHPGAWRLLHVARVDDHPDVARERHDLMVEIARRWGGTASARIVACALVGALEAAAVDWLRAGEEIDLDEVVEVLHGLLWRGMSDLATPRSALPGA
jgi:AcrR family transcriptional regulator